MAVVAHSPTLLKQRLSDKTTDINVHGVVDDGQRWRDEGGLEVGG